MASSIHNNRSSPSKTCVCLRLFNMWCWKAFKWIPVLLILGILAWSYYAYVYQLCIATLESTAQQCAYLVMYHILLIMLIWSYYQTIFSQLQDIPDKFKLPASELEKLLSAESDDAQRSLLEAYAADLPVLTRTMSGSVRYCNRCVIIKPDRAHHCSICARCVLKMDHHCPWVNNCVCFHNYKFFMLFLGYALVYCLFVMCTCMPFFIKFWKLYQKYKHAHCHDMASKGNFTKQCIEIIEGNFGGATATGRYHVVFAFFVALMFGISLGSLFGYHCYLVSHNRTTLEAFRAPMFRGGADKNGFSMGCFNNFKEVFGQHPHLWLVPIFTSRGDGLEFPVRSEHQLETFTVQQEPHGYESMGTTRSSFGDGIAFPLPQQDEDAESLLSSERWDRWGQRPRPFDDHLESSSYDEL